MSQIVMGQARRVSSFLEVKPDVMAFRVVDHGEKGSQVVPFRWSLRRDLDLRQDVPGASEEVPETARNIALGTLEEALETAQHPVLRGLVSEYLGVRGLTLSSIDAVSRAAVRLWIDDPERGRITMQAGVDDLTSTVELPVRLAAAAILKLSRRLR